jgi:hypothetical protein
MTGQPISLTRKPPKAGVRNLLEKRAKLLAWVGVGRHGIEAGVSSAPV